MVSGMFVSMLLLRELDTLGSFSAIFTRETTFVTVFAFLHTNKILKRGLL